MKSQVLHTVWCDISGEDAGEIWDWSFLGVTGLRSLVGTYMQSVHYFVPSTWWGENVSRGSTDLPPCRVPEERKHVVDNPPNDIIIMATTTIMVLMMGLRMRRRERRTKRTEGRRRRKSIVGGRGSGGGVSPYLLAVTGTRRPLAGLW